MKQNRGGPHCENCFSLSEICLNKHYILYVSILGKILNIKITPKEEIILKVLLSIPIELNNLLKNFLKLQKKIITIL